MLSAGTQASSRKLQEQESFYKQEDNFLKEKTAAERWEFSMYNIYEIGKASAGVIYSYSCQDKKNLYLLDSK